MTMRNRVKKLSTFFTGVILIGLFTPPLFAQYVEAPRAPICHEILSASFDINPLSQPIRLLFQWEQTSNTERWAKPSEVQPLRYNNIPNASLVLRTVSDIPSGLLQTLMPDDGHLRWVHHPLNTADVVPFRNQTADGQINGYYSASRSMFVIIDGDLFSFKLGTNRPHPVGDIQPTKADLLNDSDISIRRSTHIRELDDKIGQDDSFKILTELASISNNSNGYSIRDLRPLQDGHYYMPAFSIPYFGKKIAQELSVNFSELWGTYYARNLGRAKALLALRYGLQMKTPNAQNWLLQLGEGFQPTGRIFMRDVADSNYIGFIAKHVAPNKLIADQNSNYTVTSELKPYWSNSAWQMDEGGVDHSTLNNWGRIHDQSYINTFREILGIQIEYSTIEGLQQFLQSVQGQELLRSYGEQLRQHLSFFRSSKVSSLMAA